MPKARQQGFTLIELSIVLVIIGLIVGGVLVGQNLIHAAQVRAFVTQVEQYNTAVNTFQGKYDCLPGDCPNAQALLTRGDGYYKDDVSVNNGNGNGQIEMAQSIFTYGTNGSDEVSQFFLQLSIAGMINGNYLANFCQAWTCAPVTNVVGSNYPASAAGSGNGIMPFYFNAANQWYVGVSQEACTGGSNTPGCFTDSTFTPADAYAIDKKIDDGVPTTGRAQAYWGITHSDLLAVGGHTPGAALCANSSSTYNIAGSYATVPLCQMMIQFQ